MEPLAFGRGGVLTQMCLNMVPQQGIEPHSDAYKATVIPIYYKGFGVKIFTEPYQKLT